MTQQNLVSWLALVGVVVGVFTYASARRDASRKSATHVYVVVTSFHYSVAHPSPMNKAFFEAWTKAYTFWPNFMGLGGYDGMHLIYKALQATKGDASDGVTMVNAMRGMSWESPRGPVMIDPRTRDIVQNIYVRKVEKRADGKLYNVEFSTMPMVKDPVKEAKR